MKIFFKKFYPVIIAVVFAFGFHLSANITENQFYSYTDERLETYRGRLEEDGMSPSQVQSIILSAERPAKEAFKSLHDLYTSIIILLLVLAIPSFFKTLQLEKTVKELKEKLNV